MICVESDEEHLSDLTKSRYHFHYRDKSIVKFKSLKIQNGRHFLIYEFI